MKFAICKSKQYSAFPNSRHLLINCELKEEVCGTGAPVDVDDEENIRKTVRLTLTKAGFEAVETEDGKKAVRTGSRDNPRMVDAIFCDIQMPEINGKEAVAFSGDSLRPCRHHSRRASTSAGCHTELPKQGVVDYLVKPVQADTLTEIVAKHVKAHVYKDKFTT